MSSSRGTLHLTLGSFISALTSLFLPALVDYRHMLAAGDVLLEFPPGLPHAQNKGGRFLEFPIINWAMIFLAYYELYLSHVTP